MSKSTINFAICGQALMRYDLSPGKDPHFLSLCEHLRATDAAFTNFEGAVLPKTEDEPQRSRRLDPATLDTIRSMGFNLLSLANNHAFEGAGKGITYTKKLALEKGFTVAGTGSNLEESANAGILEISGSTIALIAMDSANCQTKDAIAGLNGNPGVNPLRGEKLDSGDYRLNPDDVSRILATIEDAAERNDYVFVSLHEHFWPKEGRSQWGIPSPWKQAFSRQCIDAGATAMICHGIPRACPIEVYHGKPIFHSMGNFIFHSKMECWDEQMIWEGFIATGVLAESKVRELRLLPIILVDAEGRNDVPFASRWYPAIASGEAATRILDRLVAESSALGTVIRSTGEECSIAFD